MTIEPTSVSEGLEPCPFCGATPHKGLGKVEHCQLHGEPFQRFSIWCPRRHAKITAETEAQARTAWNTRDALELTPKWVRELAARIMVAVRQAHFPKEYAAEAHDEFEVLTLAPLLSTALATLSPPLPSPGVERLREALEQLADDAEAQHCQHETTHRGGAIWTICDECEAKWADDEGGFKPYETPAYIVRARAALSALPLDGGLK